MTIDHQQLEAAFDQELGHLNRRRFLQLGVAAAAGIAVAPMFGGSSASAAAAKGLTDLIAKAKKEKQLNVIALPRDWANYGELLDSFPKKYGIKIDSQSPDISSAQELEALKSTKGQKRAPDVVDVGPQFAVQGKKDGLFQAYKGSYWNAIPADLKDADGMWVGDYYGVVALGVNADIVKEVPKSYADLKNAKYKGQVALNGDPTSANAAFSAVWAAAIANGGSLDNISPGIDYFAQLKKDGIFIPIDATPATVASGETPIVLDWTYNHAGAAKKLEGQLKWVSSVPSDGVYGGYYCQAISKSAPHPNAAKLWLEYLYSDEGQLLWLKGAAFPARFNELLGAGKVPSALASQLPAKDVMAKVKFATLDQITKAKDVLTKEWAAKVKG
jgi:putative spermidine/putrescine transport system substrate-binding protein